VPERLRRNPLSLTYSTLFVFLFNLRIANTKYTKQYTVHETGMGFCRGFARKSRKYKFHNDTIRATIKCKEEYITSN
jgi:hypothetical protein